MEAGAGDRQFRGNAGAASCGQPPAFLRCRAREDGVVRDRAAEFSRRDVSRTELVAQLEAAIAAVENGLAGVAESALGKDYPERIAGHVVATGEWLIHLASHLAYHLGQIDYHRRLVTGHTETVAAMAVTELRSARKP